MKNAKMKKRALLTSLLALFLCCTMLVGTTLAWFTDSVESGINKIVAGNLDVEVYDDKDLTDDDKGTEIIETYVLFEDTLWEPGKVVYKNVRVVNEGTLALKYRLMMDVIGENYVVEANDKKTTYKLSDVVKIAYVEGGIEVTAATEEDQRKEVLDKVGDNFNSIYATNITDTLYAEDEGTYEKVYGIVLYWEPGDEDNNWNLNNGKYAYMLNDDGTIDTTDNSAPLMIKTGLSLVATQVEYEKDSFGPNYDKNAPYTVVEVTPENIQAYLDGQYGSLDNTKLVLTAGTYGQLVIGTPTKYEGSNTVMYCETHGATFTNAADFAEHLADGQYHTTPEYTRSIENLAITAEDGVTVAGVSISSGHVYGAVTDYVLDKTYTSDSAYYLTQNITDLTFEGIDFTAKVDINTSNADTVINRVTFKDCTFTTAVISGGSSVSSTLSTGALTVDGAAIRYYNEANNGNVRNLTVDSCSFDTCYQGVYTHHINGVTVINSTFKNTVHNAIALQNHGGTICDFGNVVITNNTFDYINDRVIRFGDVGSESKITIKYNIARNSGDTDNEVIKATSIENGAAFDVNYNAWGSNAVIANDQFKNADEKATASASTNDEFSSAIENGATIIVVDDGNYVIPDSAQGKTITIIGNGNSVIATQDDGSYEGCDYSLDGATATFENITINTDSTTYTGYARLNATYNNCTINGTYTLYGDSVFNNCTFNVSGDVYNIWTWGAPNATFNNCTFNSDGKALLLYGTVNTNLTVNGCVFNDNGGLTDLKAAIEIGNDYGTSYTLTVNKTTVNGYEINDKGINTGTTLWANKNSMGTDNLNVVVDGVDVY